MGVLQATFPTTPTRRAQYHAIALINVAKATRISVPHPPQRLVRTMLGGSTSTRTRVLITLRVMIRSLSVTEMLHCSVLQATFPTTPTRRAQCHAIALINVAKATR